MVLSTVTNLDVFVEGVTAHWPLLLWENFVKEKNTVFRKIHTAPGNSRTKEQTFSTNNIGFFFNVLLILIKTILSIEKGRQSSA